MNLLSLRILFPSNAILIGNLHKNTTTVTSKRVSVSIIMKFCFAYLNKLSGQYGVCVLTKWRRH